MPLGSGLQHSPDLDLGRFPVGRGKGKRKERGKGSEGRDIKKRIVEGKECVKEKSLSYLAPCAHKILDPPLSVFLVFRYSSFTQFLLCITSVVGP